MQADKQPAPPSGVEIQAWTWQEEEIGFWVRPVTLFILNKPPMFSRLNMYVLGCGGLRPETPTFTFQNRASFVQGVRKVFLGCRGKGSGYVWWGPPALHPKWGPNAGSCQVTACPTVPVFFSLSRTGVI